MIELLICLFASLLILFGSCLLVAVWDMVTGPPAILPNESDNKSLRAMLAVAVVIGVSLIGVGIFLFSAS